MWGRGRREGRTSRKSPPCSTRLCGDWGLYVCSPWSPLPQPCVSHKRPVRYERPLRLFNQVVGTCRGCLLDCTYRVAVCAASDLVMTHLQPFTAHSSNSHQCSRSSDELNRTAHAGVSSVAVPDACLYPAIRSITAEWRPLIITIAASTVTTKRRGPSADNATNQHPSHCTCK